VLTRKSATSTSTVRAICSLSKPDFSVGFFGTPRGLGLATATTSAAFFPHFEQRSRGSRALSGIDQPTKRARAWGSM